MLIILFGLAGSGKSYVGNILASHFNFFYWDADELLSEEMKQCINHKTPFTQSMRDQLTVNIKTRLNKLIHEYKNVVVSQALYKESNRQSIRNQFPEALFVQVKAESKVIAQRLQQRVHTINEEYAQAIISEFEPPHLPHFYVVNNSNDQDIIEQITNYLKVWKV